MQFEEGHLIRSTSASPIYFVLQGKRRHIPDQATFYYLDFSPPEVHEAPQAIVDEVPLGPALPSLASRHLDLAQVHETSPLSDYGSLGQAYRGMARWLALAAIGALAIGGALLVFLLPPHLVNSTGLKPAELSQQISAARGNLVQVVTAVGLLLGLYFTLQSLQVSRAMYMATVDSQISERYAKSLDLMKMSNSLEVRLGGILALERIAISSIYDRSTIVRFLTMIIRSTSDSDSQAGRSPIEIGAILHAFSKIRSAASGPLHLDLRGAHVERVHLVSANLDSANLAGVVIKQTSMMHSYLPSARLPIASLKAVDLRFSDLRSIMARSAVILSSDLSWSDLRDSVFIGADLRETSLVHSKLSGALMIGADLRGVNIRSTDLSTVDLTDAVLTGAHANEETVWPPAFDLSAAGVSFGD